MTTTVPAPSGGAPSELIAREIRAEMGRQQLSARRLAAQLGVSYMWVSRRINTGETDLTFEDVQRVADRLGVPVTRLLAAWLQNGGHDPSAQGAATVRYPANALTLRNRSVPDPVTHGARRGTVPTTVPQATYSGSGHERVPIAA